MYDVSKLSFGTLGGRLITLAALPIATRLYTPENFALLAVYLALVSTIAAAACLRLEIAIPLAASDQDATHLMVLSLMAALIVTMLVALAVGTAPAFIAETLGKPSLMPFLWLVPLGVLMAAAYSIFQNWATRARRFGIIARTRVTQAAYGVSVMLGLGWFGLAPLGLILGNMLNIGAGSLRLGLDVLRLDLRRLRAVSLGGLGANLQNYRRYPVYSTPEALATVAGVQLPTIVIAAVAGGEAGFLFLAMQLMTAPIALVGVSISQVYVSRASEELHAGRLGPFTLGIMKRLVKIGTGPLIFVAITAPVLVPLVFGAHWARTGEIMAWMMPWIALEFIASPVSRVVHAVGRQRAMLVLTIVGLAMRGGSVFVVAAFVSGTGLVETFILGSVAYYLTVLGFVASAAGFRIAEWTALSKALLSWTVPAFIVAGLVIQAVVKMLT